MCWLLRMDRQRFGRDPGERYARAFASSEARRRRQRPRRGMRSRARRGWIRAGLSYPEIVEDRQEHRAPVQTRPTGRRAIRADASPRLASRLTCS
jgi:hypothetical protein